MANHVDLAVETTTQLITLSTAIITIAFAFVKDILPFYKGKKLYINAVVVSHLLSVMMGIWVFLAITGMVARNESKSIDIYIFSISFPSILQIVSFVIGLMAMIYIAMNVDAKTGLAKTTERPNHAATRDGGSDDSSGG